jgi:hypothetical protein
MWKAWGRMENVLKSLVWKAEERDHLEDLCKWQDNIIMDFKETRWSSRTESVWLRIEASD